MPRRHSLRATFVAVASLSALAVATACSAPPESTGQSGEALEVPIHLPIASCTSGEICSVTGTPAANSIDPSWTCDSYTVPVPTSLEGLGCTLGLEERSYPCGPDILYVNWVWACPTSSGAYRIGLDAWQNGTFGGPLPPYGGIYGSPPLAYDSCYGPVDSGWTLISLSNEPFLACSPIACQAGQCPNSK